MSKSVIYLAGPYRSSDGANGVYENINRARAAARKLWLKGYVVICPHLNTLFMDGSDLLARQFVEGDLELIHRSDAICMIDGWSKSTGAQREFAEAVVTRKKIYLGIEEVPDEK